MQKHKYFIVTLAVLSAIAGARADTSADTPDNALAGIGIVVSLNPSGLLLVQDVLVGSPAEKAGLMQGDVIQAIQSRPDLAVASVQGETLNEIVQQIRGPAGVAETLVFQRGTQELSVSLTRELIAN